MIEKIEIVKTRIEIVKAKIEIAKAMDDRERLEWYLEDLKHWDSVLDQLWLEAD